jgi:hypothetical protein
MQARLDVVHGGQAADTRSDPPATGATVGAKGAPSHVDMDSISVQDIQHVRLNS